MPSLVRLRWWSLALQVGLLVAGQWLLDDPIANAVALTLIVVGALSNAALRWVKTASTLMVAAVLTLDLALLTGLLSLAQGASNPFTALYAVSVVIAASVLPPRATAAVVVLAIIA